MRIELSRKATHCIWVFVFVFDTVCLYVCFTFFPQDWISKKSHFKWPICMWGSNGMKIGNKWEKKIIDRRKKGKKNDITVDYLNRSFEMKNDENFIWWIWTRIAWNFSLPQYKHLQKCLALCVGTLSSKIQMIPEKSMVSNLEFTM